MFSLKTLPSALKLLTIPMPQVASTAIAVMIRGGTRYEKQNENGLAHFLEHMFFKGSKKYPSPKEIALAVEGLGGYFNGWTDKEPVAYIVKVPAIHFKEGIALLADMLINPLFDNWQLEKERGVVIEEIRRRNDSPEVLVVDLLTEALFPNNSLGRSGLGEEKDIRRFSKKDVISYWQRLYQPQNMLVAIAGRINKEEVNKEIKKLFAFGRPAKVEFEKVVNKPQGLTLHFKKTEQAHLCLGLRTFSFDSPKRFALIVLNSILGKGASSRLFQRIREEKGLAYSIYSAVDFFQDTGMMIVHGGLTVNKLEEGIVAILEELKKITTGFSKKEFKEAKEKIKGPMSFVLENPMDLAGIMSDQILFQNEVLTPLEFIEKIDKVKEEEVKEVAKELFVKPEFSLALVGPFKDRKKFERTIESY